MADESGAGASDQPKAPSELPAIDLSTFVLSLSTTALYQMGLLADPETKKTASPNREIAQQTIDTLEMLREKTRGNLEADEAKLLDSLLYELRLHFVELDA
ncbi:MAG: DUF1844 domain-containing protein [Myxococcota bacterium]|jgi:hypothetical protein|nr:DUF1844 domain-containing protein [Myxococcota bacterium]